MAYLTQQDLVNLRITMAGEMQMSRIIKHLIDENEKATKEMKEGVAYYCGNHDILRREIKYWNADTRSWAIDPTATNHRLMHTFHRNLVDQKLDKILGDAPTLSSKNGALETSVNDLLGNKFHKRLQKVGKGASNKGIEWLHVYLEEDGTFRYVVAPAEMVIPIYDIRYGETLVELLRYYVVTVIEGSEQTKRWRVEWWNAETVSYYVETSDGKYFLDSSEPINPRPHWIAFNTAAPSSTMKSGSWDKVPFIPFFNNDDRVPDIRLYKTLIDEYDATVSDLGNNFADIQKVIWKLKGYEGEDLKEFMTDLRISKAIKLSADGDASAESAELSFDAQEKFLDRLERDIHLFGRGVNMRSDIIGGNPSGVALKFLFALLDIKCKDLKSWMMLGLREFFEDFVVRFINETENKKYEASELEFSFNESFIINEAEEIQNINASRDMIDDESLLAQHPLRVVSVAETQKRLAAQREAQPRIELE